ncbi:MAG: FtsH protease activity modulator HflK [Eubacterium sp.]|nr:FtsH protease activity modulator HflK [Eubacterium sp.]MCM1213842.1 FtsH protease activity modulator HflK [Lachnospiraceae bacterium]MCM1303288.1 FtsH protease activity modulator HflK [Butyrivibrio sp.]MCM1343125.1 FtsH protease activity modulator HflK [Muribaculaceae bacterium]MCM1237962.1 FtsH protease activity modulator HflK [Lachnospiraceae bacterium]
MKGDSFRNRRNGFETMDGGAGTPGKQTGGGGKVVVLAIVVIAILFLGFNSAYEIKEKEQAVLITLGRAQAVTDPGLHFKIPFIQQVRKVNTTIQGFTIGYNADTNQADNDESLMITSDFNFIDVDFYVEYRYSDPVKAIYASENPLEILRNISQSCIRTVISSYPVDDVLTTGKNEIQASIREMILARLEAQDIGIQLVNITIQDSEPPTVEVMEAFKSVETAKQGKETALNNANKYRNEQIPLAQAQADGIIKDAEAQKTERINEALAQVARFNAMYEEYIKNPVVTRQRMFYEAMEDILPDLKVIIESPNGNTQTIYPLESFTSPDASSGNNDTAGSNTGRNGDSAANE